MKRHNWTLWGALNVVWFLLVVGPDLSAGHPLHVTTTIVQVLMFNGAWFFGFGMRCIAEGG